MYKKRIFLGLLIKKSLMKLKITLQSSASTDILQVCFFLLISKILQPKFKISNKAFCYYVSSQIVLQTFISYSYYKYFGEKLRCTKCPHWPSTVVLTLIMQVNGFYPAQPILSNQTYVTSLSSRERCISRKPTL